MNRVQGFVGFVHRDVWLPALGRGAAHPDAAAEPEGQALLMDRAHDGGQTRPRMLALGMIPVVSPKPSRLNLLACNRALCKKPNAIQRLFRRLKDFRRIFSRFENLDAAFLACVSFALIAEALRVV